jgi:AcrR family transcriptional regulator
MTKPQRPSADVTRKRILEAAKTIFLKSGFDGAKIRPIAKLANVHTNQVFHHFENKQNLWIKVKEYILENCHCEPHYDLSNARAYFASIIDFRLELAQEYPDLIHLIQWQQLTESHASLVGEDMASPFNWLDDIKTLQKRNEIKDSIDSILIMLFIIYTTHAPFGQEVVTLSDEQVRQYRDIAVGACMSQFAVGE